MKTTSFRIMMLVLTVVFIISIVSCSSDDDGDKDDGIVGTWVRQDGATNASYEFYSSGTGMYHSGGNVWGDFKYNLANGNVYMQVTYVNSETHNIWKGEVVGGFDAQAGKLRINGIVYVRTY